MALIPMAVDELQASLALGVPTGEQYITYWGRTSRERYNAMFEASSVTFLGLFGSYFLSFVIGSPVATFLGAIAAFWILLGPEFKAYQRNWELIGGRPLADPFMEDDYDSDSFDSDFDDIFGRGPSNRGKGLFGAYYMACIEKVAVVDSSDAPVSEEYDIIDFQDYTMEMDDHDLSFGTPYLLRLAVSDQSGRTMQVHARMSEDYVNIVEGMPCVSILLSTDGNFDVLAGLTDFFIPDAGCFVGDYPYLNKFNLARQLETNKELAIILDEEDRIEEFWEAEDEYDDVRRSERKTSKGPTRDNVD
jgi:hypothetical protein